MYLRYLVATVFLVFNLTAFAMPLSVSEQEINRYLDTRLAEKIPLQDKIGIPGLFELDYKLKDLATKIGQTAEKKVEISGLVDGKLKLRGKQYDTTLSLNLDTFPYFEPTKGEIYLKDIRLLNWQITPEKYQNELQMFMPMIAEGLASILNHTPIYRLDETKTKEALAKKFGKAIVVEKGKLGLDISLF